MEFDDALLTIQSFAEEYSHSYEDIYEFFLDRIAYGAPIEVALQLSLNEWS